MLFLSLHLSLSVSLSLVLSSLKSFPHKQLHIEHTTQALPITTGEPASQQHQMSERLHWTGQRGRGVCREQKQGWCVVRCGWRAFVKKRDDFLLLYVLGLYLTWSSRQLARAATLSPTQTRAGRTSKRHRQSNFSGERMNFSVGFLWKVKDVGCNLWLRRE